MKEYKDALAALGVTAEEMKDFSRNYDETIRNKGIQDAFNRVDGIVQQKKMAAAVAKRQAAFNAIKLGEAMAYVDKVWADDRMEGLMSLVSESVQARPGARQSAEAISAALSKSAVADFLLDLHDAGLADLSKMIHADPELDKQIVRGLWALNTKRPTTGIGDTALKAAEIFKKHNDRSRIANVDSGGIIGERSDYTFTPNYDPVNVRKMGLQQFMGRMIGWLDEEQTFAEFYHLKDTLPNVYARKVEEFLHSAYLHITTGLHVANPADTPAMVPSGMRHSEAWKNSHKKVFIYKGPDEVLAAHKALGDGTVLDATRHTIDRRWRSTGIMRKLGPSAQQNLARLVALNLHKVQYDEAQRKKFATDIKKLYHAMGYVDGSAFAPAAGGLARGIRFVRVLQNLKLGRAGIAALFGDNIIMGMDMTHVGKPFIHAAWDAFWGRFQSMSARDRIRSAKAAGFELESLITSPWMRSDPERNYGGTMSHMMSNFFRWTGLPQLTERASAAHADGFMRLLADYGDTAFEKLPQQMQRDLEASGIDSRMWEHYREHGIEKVTRDDGSELTVMTPEGVDRAPDSAYADMAAPQLEQVSNRLTDRLDKLNVQREKVVGWIDKRIAELSDKLDSIRKMEGDAAEIEARAAEVESERAALAHARTEHDTLKMVEIMLAIEEGADVERQKYTKVPRPNDDMLVDYVVDEIGKGIQGERLLQRLSTRERNQAQQLGVKMERARAKVRALLDKANEKMGKTTSETGKAAAKQTIRLQAIDDAIRRAYDDARKESKFIIDQTRYKAQDTLRAYYQRHASAAMSKPYARSGAFMQGRTEAGSASREAMSAFWQFKSFGVNVIARQIMQVLYGRGDYKGVYHPFSLTTIARLGAGNGEFRLMTATVVGSIVSGMMINWARQITAGRKPTLPNEPDEYRKFIMNSLASGGGLGYLADVTEATMNWEKGYSAERFMGPAEQTVSTALATMSQLGKGDTKTATRTATQYLLDNFPNTFYTKAAWEWGVANNVRHIIDPDWQKRYEKLKRDNGAGAPLFGK